MLFEYSDESRYILSYLIDKIGISALDKNLLQYVHEILADYYNAIEETGTEKEDRFTPDQKCMRRLATIDSILDFIQVPRLFSERAEMVEKIFDKHEPAADLDYFLTWLENNPASNKDAENALRNSLNYTVGKMLSDIKYTNGTVCKIANREIEKIFNPIFKYAKRQIEE